MTTLVSYLLNFAPLFRKSSGHFDLRQGVTAASNEQAQGIQQINEGMSTMETSIQSNASNAEESASASEELSAQAEVLNEMVFDLTKLVYGRSSEKNEVPLQITRPF